MNLGPTKISGTYVYVLNQSGANPITLGNNGSVNWVTAGIPLATDSNSGFMSATNKIKLDGVAPSANNYVHPTQIAINVDATNNGVNIIDSVLVDTLGHVTSVTTRNLSAATSTTSGVVSADAQTIGGLKTFANGVISSVGITGTNLVYNAGDQPIGGIKAFALRPTVNGTGVLLSGEGGGSLPANIVYTDNVQTISALKTFTNGVILEKTSNQLQFKTGVDGFIGNITMPSIGANRTYTIPDVGASAAFVLATGDQTIGGVKTFTTGVILQAGNNQLKFKTGVDGFIGNITMPSIGANRTYTIPDVGASAAFVLATGTQTIGGAKNFTTRPTVNGTGVLLAGEGGGSLPADIVYTTGTQTIGGVKTFSDTGSFNTLEITNKKISSYSYNSTNFTFSNNYLNLANSSNSLTGTLPNPIISGMNYYVKNLNTGVLMITGAGSRTIDGFANVSLYKNDSLQLLGVNNIEYTGWATISADGGVS